jgi:hypothetical protein
VGSLRNRTTLALGPNIICCESVIYFTESIIMDGALQTRPLGQLYLCANYVIQSIF